MKKILFAISTVALAAGLFVSCDKSSQDPEKPEVEKITVNIKADATFDENNTAKVTLSLSKAAAADVTVTLAKAAVQSGKTEVPADFSKKVKIEKGKTSVDVNVEADVLGLESGEYQAAIQISDVSGAEKSENSVVYIALSYTFKPEINLYADNTFAGDKTAKLKVTLAKATTKDVKVKLAPAAENKYKVTIAPEQLVIPAGQTEAEAVATIEIPESMEVGVTPLVINVAELENAVKGKVSTVTVNLAYPFSYPITIDGDFSDWDKEGIITYSLPQGNVLYPVIRKMKLTGDSKYVYLYFEFVDPVTVDYYCSNKKMVMKGTALADNTMPIDIWIDADGKVETGCFVNATDNDTVYPPYANDNMGLEWYIEGGFHMGNPFTDFTGLTAYFYGGKDKENVWSGGLASQAGSYTAEQFFGQVAFDEGKNLGQAEVMFERKFFKMTTNKARFALKLMDGPANWAAMGYLPQAPATDMNNPESRPHCDMATVILPDYVE